MDNSSDSGVIERVRSVIVFTARGAITWAESAYDVVVLWISELSPGGKVRLRFLVYLSMIMSLNYLSTIGMTSSPTILHILRYNSAITKLTLSYLIGYLFVTYISQKLNPYLRHLAMATLPSMLISLLDDSVIWKTYKMSFFSFLFLLYMSSVIPRQDSMGSIGPVTMIMAMSSIYLSMFLYVIPEMTSWQRRVSHISWYFGILLGASGLIMDDLQVVMGSSGFPVSLVKRRARKYAYVVFAYYLFLYYSMAKLFMIGECECE